MLKRPMGSSMISGWILPPLPLVCTILLFSLLLHSCCDIELSYGPVGVDDPELKDSYCTKHSQCWL